MRTLWTVPMCGALAALVLLFSSEARADVVDRPPPDCPAGSSPDVCHGGPFCRPNTCVDDSECSGGETCQDAKACIGGIQCGGLEGGGDPPIATYEGSCEQGGCQGSTECTTIKLCTPSGDPTSGGGSSGGSATGTSGGGSATGGATSSPTSGATGSAASGDSAGSGEGTGGDGSKGGCACASAGDHGDLATLLGVGLLGLTRRRVRAVDSRH